jgi:hypothetical protein
MTLIYSPDESGWYWQRYSDWATSQLFRTQREAKEAQEDGLLEWSTE